MSVFSTAGKNAMLDGISPDELQLHDGDPGASGTANRVGGANGEESANFAAASNGERALSANVDFTGLSANQTVTWFSVWEGATFLGKGQITSGDTSANAAGEFSLTTATKLVLQDPT